MVQKIIWISVSALQMFQRCKRQWYFRYRDKSIKKGTDYPRLCGSEVHQHISLLYKPTKEPRPFYYKTIRNAVGAWMSRWGRALEANRDKINFINLEEEETYSQVGAICVANYFKANQSLPHPIEIEKRYEFFIRPGINLIGVFDQVRQASLEYIKSKRPELIQQGRLIDGYDPVVIIDLKTGRDSFEVKPGDPNFKKKMRKQYELHQNLQATAYIYLYEQVKGKKPIGFCWYHLRSNKAFFTFRTEKDYTVLFDVIDDFLDSLNANFFPKHVGKHCYWCDYVKECYGEQSILISPSEEIGDSQGQLQLIPNVKKPQSKQLKLKIRVPRIKKDPPL